MPNPGLGEKLARQTYEAVARLRSIKLAAQELGEPYERFSTRYTVACELLGLPRVQINLRRRPLVMDRPRPSADFEVSRVSQTLDAAGNVLRELEAGNAAE